MTNENEIFVHAERVHGVSIDPESRCAHWHSASDVIAIRFKCCADWFACFECHQELVEHEPKQWNAGSDDSPIMCGHCGKKLSVKEYRECSSTCPGCGSAFNPGCINHDHLYFE